MPAGPAAAPGRVPGGVLALLLRPSTARSRAGPPCGRAPSTPSPWSICVDVAVRQRAVVGVAAHAEVDVALDRVGVAARRSAPAIRSTIGSIVSEASGSWSGRPRPSRRCRRRRRRSSRARARSLGHARVARGVVDLVVDVGDVDDQRRLVALVLEEALEQARRRRTAGRCRRGCGCRPSARRRRCRRCPGSRGSSSAAPARARVVQADRAHGAADVSRNAAGILRRRRIAWGRVPAGAWVPPHATTAWRSSRRPSARCPSATSARSRASTRPTTCGWATWATPGRSAAPTHGARVRKGVTSRKPDVVIGTDADTWLRAAPGRAVGHRGLLPAPALRPRRPRPGRRLRGPVPPAQRPPAARCGSTTSAARPPRSRTLTMGEGPDVLLIHGLGATKSSFFDTAAALSRATTASTRSTCRASAARRKPPPRPTRPAGSPRPCVDVMDALGIERAHLVGNSMGGRVAIEVGLRHPERVARARRCCVRPSRSSSAASTRSCGCCAPSSACCPTASRAGWSPSQFWSMFADPDAVDPSVADVAVDEFQRIYGSRRRALRLPRAPRATSTSTSPSAAAASTRAWPSSRRPRCSSGARTTR